MFEIASVLVSVLFSVSNTVLFSDEPFENTREITEYYLQQNFCEDLQPLDKVSFDVVGLSGFIKHKDLLVEELTESESTLLGRTVVSERYSIGADVTCTSILSLALMTDELPSSGVELLDLYHSQLLSSNGILEFSSLEPIEQLAQVYRCINPATGKFYSTFSDPEWHPLGIFAAKLEGEGSTKELPAAPTGGLPSEEVNYILYQGWRFVVFGESPGRILVDKVVWTEVDQQGEFVKGGCGCKPKA